MNHKYRCKFILFLASYDEESGRDGIEIVFIYEGLMVVKHIL